MNHVQQLALYVLNILSSVAYCSAKDFNARRKTVLDALRSLAGNVCALGECKKDPNLKKAKKVGGRGAPGQARGLHFHHKSWRVSVGKDGTTRCTRISQFSFRCGNAMTEKERENFATEIALEVEKTVLLCASCHQKVHRRNLNLGVYLVRSVNVHSRNDCLS